MTANILHETERLKLIEEDGWQYVQRKNASGIVIMVAVTSENALVLVEQYRTPVHARVLELPAGIAGDINASETLAVAANRELEEETGYYAHDATLLFEGSVSPGLASETLTFFYMNKLEKRGSGGGVDDENITVHHVPLAEAEAFFTQFRNNGGMVDCKVYTGLHWAQQQCKA
ncbi:MAG: NUDIX hydrolase [Alphaproteobacteria bacterium]|nr:NUDIX hydrolase [Alphaproteobacteria bacterium]